MFEALSDKLKDSLKKVRGQARITEENIDQAIKEIRLSLLEADVNFKVVKEFIDSVKTKALGAEVSKNVNPGQQFTKIVHDELVAALGTDAVDLDVRQDLATIFMVGLQGSGKTTSSAKLALYVRQKLRRKPGMVSVDVYRPAAIEQLRLLASSNQIPVFESAELNPIERLKQAETWAKKEMIDVLIVDTAGRLQIDESLMNELCELVKIRKPSEVLLVADAMLGQQSVQVAEGFHAKVGVTGLVLTKVDGDARGGAALSIRRVTGVPVKFLGVGEKVGALEVFHPDRLAGRILGMGDVVSLVEKAQELISVEDAKSAARKMAKKEFTVEDFLKQMQMMQKMGGLEGIMNLLPGMGDMMKKIKSQAPPEKEFKKVEAIIRSMTKKERDNHKILNGSRRLRIAKGSGTQVSDVNKFINQFEQSQKMMSQMLKMGAKGFRGKGFPGL